MRTFISYLLLTFLWTGCSSREDAPLEGFWVATVQREKYTDQFVFQLFRGCFGTWKGRVHIDRRCIKSLNEKVCLFGQL